VSRRGSVRLGAGLLAVGVLAACGKKGPPLAPLRPMPGRLAGLAAVRFDDRLELHFTVPTANADGTTPPVLERVDIFEMSTAAGTAAPTVNQIIDDQQHLLGHIDIRRADRPAPAAGRPAAPAPGEPATFVDPLVIPAAAPASAPAAPPAGGAGAVTGAATGATTGAVTGAATTGATTGAATGTTRRVPAVPDIPMRHYVLVGVAGHRRQPSPRLDVPMSASPPAPDQAALTYDQQTLTLTYRGGAPGEVFRVYDVRASGEPVGAAPAIPSPPTGTTFTSDVVFGRERCLIVRALVVTGPVSVASAPTPPICVTPVDTFPPPAPQGLLAFAGTGRVTLTWTGVTAPDLEGYLVLRGEGSGERLQPLMTSPVTTTRYEDTTARPGLTYVYAVVAVDASPQHNVSAQSNRQTVVMR
jgi:hypothetical protein